MKVKKKNAGPKMLKVSLTAIVIGALLYCGLSMLSHFVPQIVDYIAEVFGGDHIGGMIDFYLAQLSLTFITITVTSSLSDNGNIIYWENIAEKKLIAPTWTCFLAYTCYSFITILYTTVALFFDGHNALPFFAFFGINVIALFLLTINMVDVYYNRQEKKEKLRKTFVKCASRAKTDPEAREEYLGILLGMREQTMKAEATKDYAILEENLYFLAENYRLFCVLDEGMQDSGNIDYIFSCLNDNTMGIINECIRIILSGDPDWTGVHKICEGLQSETAISELTHNLNIYNVRNYIQNMRDAALLETLLTLGDASWVAMTDSDKENIRKTIGTRNVYLDSEPILFSTKEVEKIIVNSYISDLEPLCEIAKKDQRIEYTLGEHIYNASYNIGDAGDRISEAMSAVSRITIYGLWRIGAPGYPGNDKYGEVLEFYKGGVGIAYKTLKDYEEGRIYSNLTFNPDTGHVCVRYLATGQSIIFSLEEGFLHGENDEFIYSATKEVNGQLV